MDIEKIYEKLGEMNNKQGEMNAKLDQMLQSHTKLMYCMLGIIAASLGLKFVHTSPVTVISTYIAFFTAAFLLGIVFSKGVKCWKTQLSRAVLAFLILYSTGIRLCIYQAAVEACPKWFPTGVDYPFIPVPCSNHSRFHEPLVCQPDSSPSLF